jgi:hypothetical protein
MTEPYPDQFAEKHTIVQELFINTADDNYVTARWCYRNGLNVDFFWLAVHSLEKYLKAALLVNGRSSRNFGHEIEKLYAAVLPLAPELLPTTLVKPQQYELDFWLSETPVEFVKRLYRDGQADNRYQLLGYVQHMEDLLKFDQLVYAVRPLCQPLEVRFVSEEATNSPNESRRQRMAQGKENKVWHNLNVNLEKTIGGGRGEEAQKALLDWNYPFAPPNYNHPPFNYSSSSQNPVLVRSLFDPLEGESNFDDADKLWQWVKDNIQLSKSLQAEIEKERARLKAAAKKPS